MKRPIIGMIANKYIDKEPYIRVLNKSGANIELITIEQAKYGPLLGIDGILLPGGPDIYTEEGPNIAFDGALPTRELDFAELELLDFALLVLNIPVLGICRGMHLINHYFGGSLYKHIDGHYNGDRTKLTHKIYANRADTPLVFGGTVFGPINSHHHQAIKTIGKGVRIIAQSYHDGFAEMLDVPEYKFVVGTQWHPEEMYEQCKVLFDKFVEACSG